MLKFKERNTSKTEELTKALKLDEKGIPTNFHWKNDDAKEFVDYIVDESANILATFRVVQMSGPTKEIAKILDNGKFLRPGGEYKRSRGSGTAPAYEFTTDKINLISKSIEGLLYFTDKELEDNIEGNSLEQHIKKMVAKKIANELVEAAFYSREVDKASGENGILNLFNGVKLLAEKYGNVFDAEAEAITRKIIIKAKKVLKTKYRQEVTVFMDSDIKTDFDELYNDVNGNRGDGETIKNSVSGMPIKEVPLMRNENPILTTTKSTISGTFNAGVDVITLTNATGFKVGDDIVVRYGENDEMTYKINAVSSNQITLDRGLVYALKQNDSVHKAELKGSDIILSNPKNIIVGIQRDVKIEFERVAPDGYNVWYTMRMDIQVENPEAVVLVKNLVSKN